MAKQLWWKTYSHEHGATYFPTEPAARDYAKKLIDLGSTRIEISEEEREFVHFAEIEMAVDKPGPRCICPVPHTNTEDAGITNRNCTVHGGLLS